MIYAAGVLVVAPSPQDGTDTALFLLRGPGSDHPLEWAFPGGQMEAGESAAQAAARECEEECGLTLDADALGPATTRGLAPAQSPVEGVAPVGVLQSEDVDFSAFTHRVAAQFVPALCDEHIGYCWAPLGHPPAPLHPGCSVALERPGMDELGLARAISAGRLMSPVRYENVTLFALRITGTGMAFRRGIEEYVWREPALYLNDEFLARCNGLAVIWVHPKKATLDSKEFSDRVVGSILLPYIRGDEVWGVAKVYDDEAIEGMITEQVSTSPTVVFRDPSANSRVELEDGSKLLIEGKPSLLDHVAVCTAGVWDKGGKPTGVDRSAALEPAAMTVADSQPPEPLPLLGLSILAARVTALTHRMNNAARRA